MSRLFFVMSDVTRIAEFLDYLQPKGHSVEFVFDMSEESREKFLAKKPDIVIIDRSNPFIADFRANLSDTEEKKLEKASQWMNFRSEFVKGYFVNRFPCEVIEITEHTDMREVFRLISS